jgi:hypothetical protein
MFSLVIVLVSHLYFNQQSVELRQPQNIVCISVNNCQYQSSSWNVEFNLISELPEYNQ